jgi:pimeloyl-ACP methyl ester carboxylesterase
MENISQPQDKFVTANSLKLHYLDCGNPGAVPMVLLHGLCSDAHYWDFFARNMRGDYHILALDQRGHGDSGWAQSYGPKYYVLDIEAFVAQLGLDNIVLIGHSMGGISAIIYAARHPELVNRLVIIDIGPEISATGIERMEREQSSEPEAFGSKEEVISYMRRIEPRQSDKFIRHQARYALKQDEKGGLRFKYDRALLSTELRSPQWLWEYVSQVVCPSLLVHGMESDMLTPEVAEKVGRSLVFGSVVDIEHAGHSVPGDNPDAFGAAVCKFLGIGKPSKS